MIEFFDFCNPFLYLAIVFAIFYGWRSVFIFVPPDIYKQKKCKNWDWWLYQILFNAVGAFIGWFVLYYILETNIRSLRIGHFVALIIAYLGITGNLPYAARFGKIQKS